MASIRSFEDLNCWKKAADIRKKLSSLVRKFPADERYRLIDQIIRASRSVTANMAEGFGRFHYQEFIQFCRQSRGSYYELIDHLLVAFEEKYITEDQLKEFTKDIHEGMALLNGFINYLSKVKKERGNHVGEPEITYQEQEGKFELAIY